MPARFSPKSYRIISYLLLHSKKLVSQKEIAQATKASPGLVSRVTGRLEEEGVLKRPFRTRVSLEYPEKALVDWIGRRGIGSRKAFFARSEKVLEKTRHAHTLFSGAWLEQPFLKTDLATVYVEPDFEPEKNMEEGVLRQLKSRVALIPAEDEFVFYGARKIGGELVVNPFLLYVDLASFGGTASTALQAIAEKYKFPRL